MTDSSNENPIDTSNDFFLGGGGATVFLCPECQLIMSPTKIVEVNEHWSEWQCWNCDHVFGGFSDRGSLDLGLIPPEEHA